MAPSFVPVPDIQVADAARPTPARTIPRTTAPAAQGGHFAGATESGLGLDIAAGAGGGADARGTLASFEADVRRHILAGKRQPVLAADRRNTCVVAYSVRIAAGGTLAGFSIDPCAVQAINEAARIAIRQAGYPAPPDLGAATTEVHGSLIFRP